MNDKIKQLARDLNELAKNEMMYLSHKQTRLVNQLYDSVHKEPKCSLIDTCANGPYYCYMCKHKPILTRGSDWSPEDCYKPAFATGGVISGKPGEMICSVDMASGTDRTVKFIIGCNPMPGHRSYLYDKYKQSTNNQNNMKTGDIVTNSATGERYRIELIEDELTLSDCLNNRYSFDLKGYINKPHVTGSLPGAYPTADIAEKVLLYGLLQSVAQKLNAIRTDPDRDLAARIGGIEWFIFLYRNKLDVTYETTHQKFGNVIFDTKELAQQAIDIFAKSNFDLKKLFQ